MRRALLLSPGRGRLRRRDRGARSGRRGGARVGRLLLDGVRPSPRAAPHVALAAMRAITHVVGKVIRSSRCGPGGLTAAHHGDAGLDRARRPRRAVAAGFHRSSSARCRGQTGRRCALAWKSIRPVALLPFRRSRCVVAPSLVPADAWFSSEAIAWDLSTDAPARVRTREPRECRLGSRWSPPCCRWALATLLFAQPVESSGAGGLTYRLLATDGS
jgi:hypothetical protein